MGLLCDYITSRRFVSSSIQDFQLAKELLSREEWCGRGLSIISRYFRSDNGVNKVEKDKMGSLLQFG